MIDRTRRRRKPHGSRGGRWNSARTMRSPFEGRACVGPARRGDRDRRDLIDRALQINPNWRRVVVLERLAPSFRRRAGPDDRARGASHASQPARPVPIQHGGGHRLRPHVRRPLRRCGSMGPTSAQEFVPSYVPPARIAAASHALAGRIGEARKFMARVRELDPTFASPISATSIHFADRKTLPDGRMVFARLAYRSERDIGAFG